MSRRDLLAAAGLAPLAGFLPGWSAGGSLDLVIRDADVFDGAGDHAHRLDIGVRGDRIVALARRLRAKGAVEIDARGLVAGPGFVDVHSHADGTLEADPRLESVVRQGITSVVVGADGFSRIPDDKGRTAMTDWFADVDQLQPGANVASMVGLGRIRQLVVGDDDRPATSDELARMVDLVQRALRSGAAGASAGLEYTPGAFASRDELVALCRPLARYRLPYSPHMRNEDDRLLEAVEESLEIGRRARCPVHLAHLKTQGPRNWSKLDQVFRAMKVARQAGRDVTFDRYPYLAYQTGLANLFPLWSRDGGDEAFVKRLADSSLTARLTEAVEAKVALIGGWDRVLISGVSAGEDKGAEGKRMSELGEGDRYRLAVGLLERNGGDVGMVGFAMSEDNLERILQHPHSMVASDGGAVALEGPARRGHPHPRSLGSFPRVLGHYVRERKVLSLGAAFRKMSLAPARRVRLDGRGRIALGWHADLVVFDPATVADRATFADPFAYPDGITAVVVNGRIALREGQRGPGAGRALRSGGAHR